MTAKEYLQRPKQIVQEIRRKQGRIETLKRLATRLGPEMSGIRVQTTPDPARIQGFLAEAADEELEIRRLEEAREQALADSALLISRLPDEKMARILELRYLDSLPWEEITDRTGFGASTVYRLHRLALDILDPPPDPGEENIGFYPEIGYNDSR